jgi:hypothetical protein
VDVILTEDLGRIDVKKIKIRDQILRIASIDDLIRMKEGTGRPQDREGRQSPQEAAVKEAAPRPVQFFSDEYLLRCRRMPSATGRAGLRRGP